MRQSNQHIWPLFEEIFWTVAVYVRNPTECRDDCARKFQPIRGLFLRRQYDFILTSQSKENKNNDISKTPKKIHWYQLQHWHWEYTYLGTRLTPTGNFTLALEHLKEKAMHAFSSIRKHSTLNRLRPYNASQIFDTIFPILSYNSEIWGMYTKQDFKTWDRSPM